MEPATLSDTTSRRGDAVVGNHHPTGLSYEKADERLARFWLNTLPESRIASTFADCNAPAAVSQPVDLHPAGDRACVAGARRCEGCALYWYRLACKPRHRCDSGALRREGSAGASQA